MEEIDRQAPDNAEAIEPKLAPVAGSGKGNSRRTMLKIGLATGPVVLMRNRPAWANGSCNTPSAWMSINQAGGTASHTPVSTCGLGRSPGYWKQGYNSSAPYDLLSPQPGNHSGDAYPASNATFKSIFGSGPSHNFGYLLWSTPGSTEFHFIGAYLNALNSNNGSAAGITNFPITPTQVIQMYNGTFHDEAGTWTQAQGLNYIDSLES